MKSPNLASIDSKKSTFYLKNYLQRLQFICQKLNLSSLIAPISNILYCLENNSFSIGVFGNFNCGKSTFINALISKDILPVDILATTATISRITHRETPGAKILLKDNSEQEVTINELADYITKLTSDTAEKAAKIQESVIYYPIPYYQNQLEIIDTPGLNDDEEMTAVTSEIINQCDVAIMLVSAISPFGITEAEFLTTKLLANGISRVLFVINSIDLLDTADVEKIINLISNRIYTCIQEWAKQEPNSQEILNKLGKMQIHGISAFQALEAKTTRDIPLLAQSRFVNFEHQLKTLINQERGLIQLQTTCNRITTYATEILSSVKYQESEFVAKITQLSEAKENINYQIEQLRCQKTELITSFDNTLSNLQKQAHLYNYRLETKLKGTAKSTISSNKINIGGQSDIAKLILTAVQNATRDIAKQIQTEIKTKLNQCLMQLKNFTQLCEQFMSKLDLDRNSKILEIISLFNQYYDSFIQLKPLSLPFPNNPEIFTFKTEANIVKTVAGDTISSIVFRCFTIGENLGYGIAESLGTGENQQINKFREKYTLRVIAAIDEQLKNMNVNQQIERYISQIFSPLTELQNLLVAEVKSILDDKQNQLSGYFGKQEIMNKMKQQEVVQMRAEIEKIIDEVKNFSQQLSQVSA